MTIHQKDDATYGHILTYDPELNVASITQFYLLRRLDEHEKIFILFTPLTGKKHQLRLHSAFLLGAPIIGDHRYGYPRDEGGMYSVRTEDGVYKDGYALHCYRIAAAGPSVQFDITAGFPDGRWGDVWNDVRDDISEESFAEQVRQISKQAADVFAQEDIQRFIADPKAWAKRVRGPVVKSEIS